MNKKNITIDDELKLLEKYILNSSHAKTIKNNTTSSFLSEGRIYPFANDILNSSVNIDLTGKKSLVVTSSGDHALHAILAGSTDITSFDINRFCKYYSALKIAAIKRYSYEEFHDRFPKFIMASRRKLYDIAFINRVILDSSLYLNDDELRFWNCYLHLLSDFEKNVAGNFMYSPLFYRDYSTYTCAYEEKDKYNKLRGKLGDINITYIDSDIGNLDKNVSEMYDYIHISNILDYSNDNKTIIKTLKSLKTLLLPSGIIDACMAGFPGDYYDNVGKKVEKYFYIENIKCSDSDAIRLIKK